MNVSCCISHDIPMTYYKSHSHKNNYEIIYCTSGRCKTFVDDKEFLFEKSDLLIIPPNTPHRAISDIEFTDFYIQAKSINFNEVMLTRDNDGKILTLMTILEELMIDKGVNYHATADSILETVCNYLVRSLKQNYKYQFTQPLKNIILDNFADPSFDLAEEIRKIGYNKDYLRRCFENDIGKSPLEYLTELRINKAKSLLLQSDFDSVSEVSRLCGFTDNLYFSTVFKKHTGLSPMQFRKMNLQKI